MAALRRRYRRAFGRHPIRMVHLNDLRSEPGSRHDRHEHIGRGNIGAEAIHQILTTSGMRSLPVILETPVDESCDDADNLAAARRLSLDSPAGHGRK